MTVKTTREAFTKGIVPVNTDVSNAVSVIVGMSRHAKLMDYQLYTHSKILVAALNGPVMGVLPRVHALEYVLISSVLRNLCG